MFTFPKKSDDVGPHQSSSRGPTFFNLKNANEQISQSYNPGGTIDIWSKLKIYSIYKYLQVFYGLTAAGRALTKEATK